MEAYRYVTFETTTDAIAFEKRARELSIPGRIIPTPREIRATCGLSFRIPADDYERCRETIDGLDILFTVQ